MLHVHDNSCPALDLFPVYSQHLRFPSPLLLVAIVLFCSSSRPALAVTAVSSIQSCSCFVGSKAVSTNSSSLPLQQLYVPSRLSTPASDLGTPSYCLMFVPPTSACGEPRLAEARPAVVLTHALPCPTGRPQTSRDRPPWETRRGATFIPRSTTPATVGHTRFISRASDQRSRW